MNRYTLTNICMFAIGAAAGSIVTWKLLDEKYKQIVNEEIESMREYFLGKTKVETTPEDNDDTPVEHVEPVKVVGNPVESSKVNIDFNEYSSLVKEENYYNYSGNTKPNTNITNLDRPYVITPEEFDEMEDYETFTLYYYADKVLTNDRDIPIEDVDSIVGKDSLNHFGQYEDDSVYVRNDLKRADYEILLYSRKYADIANITSHPEEDE